MSGKAWAWVLFTAGVVVLGAGAGFFVWLGLSKANQLASVLSLFVSVVGLGATIAGLVMARRNPLPAQAITRSSVGGNVEVFRGVRGDITLTRSPASSVPAPPPSAATTPVGAPASADQVITDSGIAGSARVVDDVTGNIKINE
ncbi:hypothetical protein AB0G00_36860 [Nocardia salmonicida]|uniref:hypothetical protein n=1 Tax=Nocardia salmonicida TaxID=53431 RepID=UPI0033D77EBC